MRPLGDCVIEFPYESKLALKTEPKIWPCTVVSADKVSSTVCRLVIAPQDGPQDIVATFMGAHEEPVEFAGEADALDGVGFYRTGHFPDTQTRMAFYERHAFTLAQRARWMHELAFHEGGRRYAQATAFFRFGQEGV